jgi:hypothetical protein
MEPIAPRLVSSVPDRRQISRPTYASRDDDQDHRDDQRSHAYGLPGLGMSRTLYLTTLSHTIFGHQLDYYREVGDGLKDPGPARKT